MKSKGRSAVSDVMKMRETLNKLAKQREDSAAHVAQLDSKMIVGTENLSKITKTLKNKDTVDISNLTIETDVIPSTPFKLSTKTTTNTPKRRVIPSAESSPMKDTAALDGMNIIESYILPSGNRVSDWCYNSPFDSTPPG